MNIREALTREHSKRNTTAIVNYIGQNEERFAELMTIFKTADYRLIQRAAWPVSYIAETDASLLLPYWKELFEIAQTQVHPSFKRNLLRTLRVLDTIPQNIHSEVIEMCMQVIPDGNEPAAVRAFAIHIMGKLLAHYPEFAGELSALLEPLLQHDLPSIRSSSKHVLKLVSKIYR